MPRSNKISRLIQRMAEDYGVSLEIREGGKHNKVYMNDRMIAVLSRGDGINSGRALMNSMQHIRKAIEVELYGRETADTEAQRNAR